VRGVSAQRAIDFGYGPNPPEVEAAFEATPPEMVAEILDGELHVHPRPAPRHAAAQSDLHGYLFPFTKGTGGEGPGGWVILIEPELHLGPRPDKIAPDLAGWRRERMPDRLGPEDGPGHYAVAPDWVCEVISPRTEQVDRLKKMRIYRRERVEYVWLVNPVEQLLEVYRLEGERYTVLDTFAGDDRVRAAPFEALELPLAELWAK